MNAAPVDLKTFVPYATIEDLAENWTVEKDIPYFDPEEKDEYRRERCILDIYYPENRSGVPVIIYFHGGGLINGDKSWIIQETRLLNCVLVSVEYRLSPQVKTPAWIEDSAMAAAWVKRNIAKYHGDPENIFMLGQSAGSYLLSMLAADERYLRARGCDVKDFRGYMSISGEMMTHMHVREEQGISIKQPVIDEYAPLTYVRKDFPPILMMTGEAGLEIDCRPAENKFMHDLLVFNGCTDSCFFEMKSLTHGTIWDSINAFVRDFIIKYLKRS